MKCQTAKIFIIFLRTSLQVIFALRKNLIFYYLFIQVIVIHDTRGGFHLIIHSVEITEIYSHTFKKIRECNMFTKQVRKELISRNFFG